LSASAPAREPSILVSIDPPLLLGTALEPRFDAGRISPPTPKDIDAGRIDPPNM